jgi:hypothetical protein
MFRYENCATYESGEQVDECGHGPQTVAIGPDETIWAVFPESNAEPEFQLYGYPGTLAVRATPLGLLEAEGYVMAAVTGGSLLRTSYMRTESYWLDAKGNPSLQFYDAYLEPFGEVVRYGPDQRVVLAHNCDLGLLDPETRTLEPLVDLWSFAPDHPDNGRPCPRVHDGGYLYMMWETDPSEDRVLYRCDPTLSCSGVPVDDPRFLLLQDAVERITDGVTTYVRTSTFQHHFMRADVISEDVSQTIYIVEVMILGGQIHFTGVNQNNVGGLFRVDFTGTEFVYTQVENYESEVAELIELGVPSER